MSSKKQQNKNDELEIYKLIFDSAVDVLMVTEPDGKISYLSKSCKRLCGHDPKDFIGKTANIIYADDNKLVEKEFGKSLKGQSGKNLEYRILTKNKEIKWVSHSWRPIFKNKKLYKIISSIEDITQKKKIDEELKLKAENYQSIFENANDALFIHDGKTGKIEDINKQVLKLLGYKSKKEILGKTVADYSLGKYPYTAKEAKRLVGEALKKGSNVFEWRAKKQDGTLIWAEVDLKRIVLNGELKVLAVTRDITKDKEFVDKLEESEKKYRTVLENTTVGFVFVDRKGNIFEVNKAYCKMLGYTKSQLLKLNIQKIDVDCGTPQKLAKKNKMIFDAGALKFEAKHRKNNGDIIDVEISMKIRDDKKTAFAFITDITKEKEFVRKLEESEKNNRLLIENIPDLIFVFDKDGNFLDCKSYKNKKLLMTPKDFICKNVKDVMPLEVAKKTKKYLNLACKTKKLQTFEYDVVMQGKRLFYEVRLIPENGNRYLALSRDITARKESELKLVESEEKYRNFIERASDGILIIQDRKVKYANPRLKKMLDREKENILNKSFVDYVHRSEIPKVLKRYIDRISGKEVVPVYESKLRKKNGEFLEVELNAGLIKYEGKIADMVIVRDITERKKAEKSLKEKVIEIQSQKDKIATIVKSIGDGVFVVNKKMEITLFNDVASKMTGFSEKEVLGNKCVKHIHFADEKTMRLRSEIIKEVMKEKQIRRMSNHLVLVDKQGNKTPVSVGAAPLFDLENKDEVIGCVVVFRDVTRERKIENLKSEFVSVASHQLRTPLSGIKWFVELLFKERAGKLTEDQKDYLNQVHRSNERLIKLVADLLDVSHIEAGRKFFIEKKKTNIAKILKELLKESVALVEEKGVNVKICPKLAKGISLKVDPDKIKQVFYNIVTNAIKYSQKGDKVEICFKEGKKNIVFEIKDEGLGIPARDHDKVFDKFFRAENVMTTQTDGTGLGLYIAKAMIEAHGGKIWFESKINKGTTFYVSLPKK